MKNMNRILIATATLLISTQILAATVGEIAKKSLETNIVKLDKGLFLSAGAHQFKSFWTRDFCFSSRGLLAIHRGDVVKSHLTYLINNRRNDDLVPLYVDSIQPVNRVVTDVLFKAVRLNSLSLPITNDIKPFYLVNNEHEAIDSNLMVLDAAQLYAKETKDTAWFNSHQNSFRRIFDFYKKKKQNSLIYQTAHADWQDSASRQGFTFFTNLLYYHMAREYKFMNATELTELKNKIVETFYDKKMGVFLSMAGRNNVSLEGNLWAIEHGLIANPEILYRNLTNHPLYTKYKIPGFATYPSYSFFDTYIQVKVVGLQEYHGSIYWSWLIAYAGKIAHKMNDIPTYNKIYANLNEMAQRDQTVFEIYNNNNDITPFKSSLYKSESPFSWGSAFVVDMVKSTK
jgi:hypothetical protein